MSEANILKGACIIGQSGGPTAVINASAYGAIRAGLDSDIITKVYGAAHGIKGVLDDKLYDMDLEDADELKLLLRGVAERIAAQCDDDFCHDDLQNSCNGGNTWAYAAQHLTPVYSIRDRECNFSMRIIKNIFRHSEKNSEQFYSVFPGSLVHTLDVYEEWIRLCTEKA